MTTIATMPTGPALFVRGIARTVAWGVYDASDDAVTPSAVEVHLERNGATVATLTGAAGAGSASTTYTPAATATLADDYVLVWTITEASGAKTLRRQVASVCLQELLPVIRIATDIVPRMRSLDPNAADCLLSRTPADAKAIILDAMRVAFDDIEDYLYQQGRRAHLVLNSEATRKAHALHTIDILLDSVAVSIGGHFENMAQKFHRQYRDALREMVLQYAPADGNGAGQRSRAAAPLMAGGSWDVGYIYDYQQDVPSTQREY
jgi:hypothetical protein